MSGINRVILLGNLGKDPEIRYLDGGIQKLTLSIATSEYYKDKSGQPSTQTEWHNLVFWRTLAENGHKLLKKGDLIYVEGKLQTRHWQDKDGNSKQITEIVCDTFQLVKKT